MEELTLEQQAALGRLAYAIRATVMGLRNHGEDFDLIIRAVMTEAINLCLTKFHGRSLTSGQAEFSAVAELVWAHIAHENPELTVREQTAEGGN